MVGEDNEVVFHVPDSIKHLLEDDYINIKFQKKVIFNIYAKPFLGLRLKCLLFTFIAFENTLPNKCGYHIGKFCPKLRNLINKHQKSR